MTNTKIKLIHTGWETAYEEWAALDYFHDNTNDKYLDEKKYKVVAIKWKEITDEEDIANGVKDWEWEIKAFRLEVK